MAGKGLDVQVKVTGLVELERNLAGLTKTMDALPVMQDIADRGAQLARSFAPRRSGALVSSIRGFKGHNKAVVLAGSPRVPYAQIQNTGSRRRNIEGSEYMRKADDALKGNVPSMLQSGVNRAIKAAHL